MGRARRPPSNVDLKPQIMGGPSGRFLWDHWSCLQIVGLSAGASPGTQARFIGGGLSTPPAKEWDPPPADAVLSLPQQPPTRAPAPSHPWSKVSWGPTQAVETELWAPEPTMCLCEAAAASHARVAGPLPLPSF